MRALLPANETERLEALRRCGILDTDPEPTFDEIATLAGQLCATPMALVSLVDADRQWFKARVGLPVCETPRDVSFCAHTLVDNQTLVVGDTLQDTRFAGNPLVTSDPNIRFYAGVPLTLDGGLTVGTLCVLDRVPRELSPAQLAALGMLARQVTTELGLRRALSLARAERALSPASSRATPSYAGVPGPAAELPGAIGEDAVIARRYRIERLIGAGGMGVVAAAEDLQSGEPVAIKFLIHHQADQRDGQLERFVREAQALLRVQSEHVVRVLDVGNLANGAPFIVMERLEGEDLGARLISHGPGAPEEVVDAIVQACAAVGSAHACGIVHRDLKPANLFMARQPDGRRVLKVLDFGVSKLGAYSPALTQASTMVGSAYYMSPEQMHGLRELDGRSDVWALGVTLYELLTGRLPFEGGSISEVCSRVLYESPASPQRLRPDLPPALCAVILRCLTRDPGARYPTAEALAEALVGSLPASAATSTYRR